MIPPPTSFFKEAFDFGKDLTVVLKEAIALGVRHPLKSKDVANVIWQCQQSYFSTQKKNEGMTPYLIYSEVDQQIPFRPEESVNYNELLPLLMVIIKNGIEHHSRTELQQLVNCFLTANDMAQEVYRSYQTIMPRFTVHQQWGLHLVQWIDLPVNCCPSMHVAFSSLMYNFKEDFIPLDRQVEVKKTLEKMAASVLYTKQHALADVAFGFLCAKMAYEQQFGTSSLEILGDHHRLQEEHPTIPYDAIHEIYQRGKEEYRKGKSLVEIVGDYIKEEKFPLVSEEVDLRGCYFDTKEKKMMVREPTQNIY